MDNEPKTVLPEQTPDRAPACDAGSSGAQSSVQGEELIALQRQNARLTEELETLRREKAEREEREQGLAHLRALAGENGGAIYERALEKAQNQEELASLPFAKRCELAYYLCLGQDFASKAEQSPPAFARSGGSGSISSVPMKKPTDLKTARENAARFLGV